MVPTPPGVRELQSESKEVAVPAPLTPCTVSLNTRNHFQKVVHEYFQNQLVLGHDLVGLSGMNTILG